ncbi:MAG: TerD family protein, partial [Gordonia sp. (in: high G+C Gram-positive bacteria)]
MPDVPKGSKTGLTVARFDVTIDGAAPGLVDLIAVLLTASGTVRTDADLVFFNNPQAAGVSRVTDTHCVVDLGALPPEIDRVVVAASTEAQGATFARATGLAVTVRAPGQDFRFRPPDLSSETVLQLVAFYRRGGGWKLDAIGQGYRAGLAAFATDFGISVDDEPARAAPTPVPAPTPAPAAPANPAAPPITMSKVKVSITKDSASKTASIDLRKSGGDPSWVLTVGLEWDGRGAKYHADGSVRQYGTGDLDVY